MTIARIQSYAFSGIEAVPVEVQVQISSGVPAFLVVGLPDKAVGEARERVRAALTAMGLALPPRRVLINLAPADLLKEGSHFDSRCSPPWTCCRARMSANSRPSANCRSTGR
jgi:magnesium chelatase family protein